MRKFDVVYSKKYSKLFSYMAITYYQAILAFCLQDGPEALTQVRRLRKGHLG